MLRPPPWPQAPRARWGAVMKARRAAFVPWGSGAARPSPGRVSSAARFAALAVVVGLAASGRKASSVVCARFTPAPPLSARPRCQNGGRGLAWLVVRGLVAAPVLRAPASPSARARRVLGRVVRGGPRRFFPEALAPGNARASGRFISSVAAVTGLAFLRSRTRVSALPRPAPFMRAGRDKARSNQVGSWE